MTIPAEHDPEDPGQDTTRKVLVVMAHPAASSLTRSITSELVRTLHEHGHDTEVADLAAEGFDPLFGPADHAAFSSGGALPADVRFEQQRIDSAGRLVLVYPVYWWAMPALLKGWIDRVFVSGWAFDENPQGDIVKKLHRLKVSLIAVAGATEETYDRRGYRDAMRVQIETGIFDFCGAPVIASRLVTPEQMTRPSAIQDIVRTTAEDILARQ